jgi:3-oxoacyl-[acyl-carrier protein] reductase
MHSAPRSALVTGGSKGLGREIALRLAAAGMRIGVLARTETEVEAIVADIKGKGGEAFPLITDVLRLDSLQVAVERFANWAQGIDTLVCAAGRLKAIGPFEAVDAEDWWLDLKTTVGGSYNSIRASLPSLRASKRASISILIGPGHQQELAFASGYATGQAALARMVETLDKELKGAQIPIYAVNPGLVPTPLMNHLLASEEGRRWLPRFTEAFAEGKEVGPERAAEVIAWLAFRRPRELSGRVVSALLDPSILETRLGRIEEHDLNRLRMK